MILRDSLLAIPVASQPGKSQKTWKKILRGNYKWKNH